MKATDANKISIRQYLADKSIHPKQDKVHYGMYLSPLRAEITPSFKVDFNQNVWYDFGLGEGGTLIDLIMKLQHCTFYEAITQIEKDYGNNSLSFQGNDSHEGESASATPQSVSPTASKIEIAQVLPINNLALIQYATERAINPEILKEHCQEVHFTMGGRQYFAIGFTNDAGGWVLRNKYFKGCSSPMNITTIDKSSPTCLLFEGFMDMLSYLTLKNTTHPNLDMVMLNSVVNLSKATDFLKCHQTIHTFLDNDEAGKRAVEQLHQTLPNSEIVDQSTFYRNHKDLNEYLCARKLEKLQTIKPENNLSNSQVSKQNISPIKPKVKSGLKRKM